MPVRGRLRTQALLYRCQIFGMFGVVSSPWGFFSPHPYSGNWNSASRTPPHSTLRTTKTRRGQHRQSKRCAELSYRLLSFVRKRHDCISNRGVHPDVCRISTFSNIDIPISSNLHILEYPNYWCMDISFGCICVWQLYPACCSVDWIHTIDMYDAVFFVYIQIVHAMLGKFHFAI